MLAQQKTILYLCQYYISGFSISSSTHNRNFEIGMIIFRCLRNVYDVPSRKKHYVVELPYYDCLRNVNHKMNNEPLTKFGDLSETRFSEIIIILCKQNLFFLFLNC